MTDIDREITRLEGFAAELNGRIQDRETEILELRVEQARLEGELTGLRRAAELFGGEGGGKQQRNPVQKLIMPLLDGSPMSEAEICERLSGIPAKSIHDFLVAAVRQGKIRRDDAFGYQAVAVPHVSLKAAE